MSYDTNEFALIIAQSPRDMLMKVSRITTPSDNGSLLKRNHGAPLKSLHRGLFGFDCRKFGIYLDG